MEYNKKKQRPLISIIVPVYKVEHYLSRCVESIINQTYRNFELILVDDGSPDNCGKICDEYAEKYDFIRVIHQKNQGLSAARNNAVPSSRGQYITFIDSDDFVTNDYLEYLLSLLNKYNTQISVGGRVYQYDNKPVSAPKEETKSGFCSVEDALITMNYGMKFSVYAWGKLYKRELVEANPYPVGKLYEDIATTYRIVGDSTGVAYGNKEIYYWLQRSNSIMHSGFNDRQFDGIEAAQQQLEYIEKYYPNAIPAAKYRYTAKAVELAGVLFSSGGNRDTFRKLKKYMSKYSDEILKDSFTKRSMYLRIKAMKLGYLPAKIVFYLHDRAKKKLI